MTLFIGGSKDGQDIPLKQADNGHPLMNYIRVAKPVDPVTSIRCDDDLQSAENERWEEEVYKLEFLRGEKRTFPLFVASEISPDGMIQSLVDNYRPEPFFTKDEMWCLRNSLHETRQHLASIGLNTAIYDGLIDKLRTIR